LSPVEKVFLNAPGTPAWFTLFGEEQCDFGELKALGDMGAGKPREGLPGDYRVITLACDAETRARKLQGAGSFPMRSMNFQQRYEMEKKLHTCVTVTPHQQSVLFQ
jgi:hypothetical protein